MSVRIISEYGTDPMKITCISCQHIFSLDSDHIDEMGSLVRCTQCHFIFIVFPQDDFDHTLVQDTNIDQSLLDTLFRMEHASGAALPIDEISDEWNSLMAEGILPIEDFDEEAGDESESDPAAAECGGLPDLSEYENMIDWSENSDPKKSPPAGQKNQSRSGAFRK